MQSMHQIKGVGSLGALLLVISLRAGAAPAPLPDNGPCAKALREAVEAIYKVNPRAKELPALWCAAADLHRKLGDRKDAVDALVQARKVAEALNKFPMGEYRRIGEGYGRLGDAKAVLHLAAAIPQQAKNWRGNPRETVLRESALAAAEAGHFPEAERIASELASGDWVKASIRRLTLVRRVKAGEAARSIREAMALSTVEDRLFALVGQDVFNFDYDDHDASKPDGVASALLAAKDRVGAKEAARKALGLLPDVSPKQRSSAVLAVVRMLARLDDPTAARKALSFISKVEPNAASLKAKGYIAAAEVRAGRDKAAIALAGDFDRPGEQAYILHFVALAQARAGRKATAKIHFTRALELLAKDADGPGTTRHNIASAMALAGDVAGAAKVVKEGRELTWSNVAWAQVEAGDYEGARKTAAAHLATGSRWLYMDFCQGVACCQVKGGQVAEARKWAKEESDPLLKAHILMGIAEGFYREGGKLSRSR